MRDLIASYGVRVLELLFPSKGGHRVERIPIPAPAPSRPRRALPDHKSPYAREVIEWRPIEETAPPVRPFIFAAPHRRQEDSVRAERRWALDMAARGLDVGPDEIHGVHVKPGSRTLRIGMPDSSLTAA